MRIYVKKNDTEKPINITIPNSVVLNKLTSHIIAENSNINEKDLQRFMHELQQAGHFNFIHVETDDGKIVDIDL